VLDVYYGAYYSRGMNTTSKVQSVTYETSTGTMTVTYDRPEWVVADSTGTHRFESVPAWMAYARGTHGWPLVIKAV